MKNAWDIISQAFRQWLQDGAFILAAALAFYSAISLAPLVTISLSVASIFYGTEALRGELIVQVERYAGTAGAEVIQGILANASRDSSGVSALLSILMLLIGASAVFAQLQVALNKVWNVAPNRTRPWMHTAKVRLLSIGLVLAIGVLLVGFTLGGAVLSSMGTFVTGLSAPGVELMWQAVNFLLGIFVITVLFAALFKLLPDARIRWRDVWVGALTTSALFNLGRLAIGLYLGKSAPGSAYGTAGSLVALLFWLFYSALIILFGAEFTQVYARRIGERIRPAPYAHRTSTVALPVDDDGNPFLDDEARETIKGRVECPPSTNEQKS